MNEDEEKGMEPALLEILRSEPEIAAWLQPDEEAGERDEQPR